MLNSKLKKYKKPIFLVFFLILSHVVRAHEDMIIGINQENIRLEYKSGWREFEIENKIDILIHLAKRLLISKGYTKDQIYIYFNHDYLKRDTSYYALGYGEFTYWNYEKEKLTEETTRTGLTLILRDRDFDIEKMLNLINCAFANTSSIKANQKQLVIDRHLRINGIAQFDTLYTIPPNQITKYLSLSDTTITRLVNEKTYRNLKKTDEEGDIDYYYQNNKFHFYNTRGPDKEWSQELEKYVTKTFGEDILVVDNILEIFGNFYNGHFIFINDSVFYYIPQLMDNISGPFKVDSVSAGRQPVHKYDHEYYPLNRFTLFFENNRKSSKALFFPDSNVVISNFDKLETKLINEILISGTLKNTDNTFDVKLYSILMISILSIALNIWLWVRKSK